MRSVQGLGLRCALITGIFLLPASGAVITYASRASFAAAAPAFSTETFESGLVSAGSVTVCDGPLSSASGSDCFNQGTLLPGVTYDASSNRSLTMAVIGADYNRFQNASKAVGPGFAADSLDLTFARTSAVGFDVIPSTRPA